MEPKPHGDGESPDQLGQAILALREELMNSTMTADEINGVLQAFANRSPVEIVKPIELWSDHELEDEAERRSLSWLTLESDGDLLKEVERRELMTNKANLTEEEFEKEAERRGYRSSLAQFPIEEIQTYMRLQGHTPSKNSGSRRSGKKRQKRRNSHPPSNA